MFFISLRLYNLIHQFIINRTQHQEDNTNYPHSLKGSRQWILSYILTDAGGSHLTHTRTVI